MNTGTVTIEVTNLLHRARSDEIRRVLLPRCGGTIISLAYTERSGKAHVELPSREAAESAIREISRCTELSFRASDGRTLRAAIVAGATAGTGYKETSIAKSWVFEDKSAEASEDQRRSNAADQVALFDRLPAGPMRASLVAAVDEAQVSQGRVLKEFYLPVGRPCELVYATPEAGGTHIDRSAEVCQAEHLEQFEPLFDGLSEQHRRTGIDLTLHRVSRTIHAITKGCTAITARVGRTIQGHTLPMLVEMPCAQPLDALAELARSGLLLIGPPNVGKTTVLRELARLLADGNRRVVVVVDKSLEIAGTGVVPHAAIGHARVLTVAHIASQAWHSAAPCGRMPCHAAPGGAPGGAAPCDARGGGEPVARRGGGRRALHQGGDHAHTRR